MKRYAVVRGNYGLSPGIVQQYLPSNYYVIWQRTVTEFGKAHLEVVIEGEDVHGWTLSSYVIPRLGSGLMMAIEIDLSHPVMKEIPVLGMGTCTDNPGDGSIYHCHNLECPVHGDRNRNLVATT